MPALRTIVVAVVAFALLTVAGTSCSSSSGGGGEGVSTSQLAAKLKKEPQLQQLIKAGGAQAGLVNKLIACVAGALRKDVKTADLKNYLAGRTTLRQISGTSQGSVTKVQSDAGTCAQKLAGSAPS